MTNPNEKPAEPAEPAITPIAKPDPLAKFKSKRPINMSGVEALPEVLPHYPVPDAQDFVRLHPDEEAYWSGELCLVKCPSSARSVTPCT